MNIGQSITLYFVIHTVLHYIVTHMSKQIVRSLPFNKNAKCTIGPPLSVFQLLYSTCNKMLTLFYSLYILLIYQYSNECLIISLGFQFSYYIMRNL